MSLRGRGEPTRWQRAIAVVAALSLLSALAGCWALRVERATWLADPVVASHDAVGIGPARKRNEIGTRATGNSDHGSSSTGHKPFKSPGLKRDRPPTWSRSAPSQWSLPTPASLTAAGHPAGVPGAPAPAVAVSSQDIVNLLCVARC
ncbi:hypothetical protein A4G27_23080 [Mycobacterium kansasii]|nr:hypothetical protein A4G27_23080 [Mycobacterium kansasii]